MEVILELLAEFALQILGELLIELGVISVREAVQAERTPSPLLAGIGYGLLAALVGGLSLLVFPKHLIRSESLRIANLIVLPISLGLLLNWRRKRRIRRDRPVLRLTSFPFGALFALVVGGIRYYFAK